MGESSTVSSLIIQRKRQRQKASEEKEEEYENDAKTEGRSSFGHDPFMDRISAFPEDSLYQDLGTEYQHRESLYENPIVEAALAEEMVDRSSSPRADPFTDRHSYIGDNHQHTSRRSSGAYDTYNQDSLQDRRAESYAYNSIYAGYAESETKSRSNTMHELDPKTPATSTLLPWLQDKPQPPLPRGPQLMSRKELTLDNPSHQPSLPRPAMARSPTVHGGWEGVIPPFR